MDPLTKAAKVFMAALRAFWEPPPGHEPAAAAVRLVVGRDERRDAEKALRLMEWQLDNRHPLVLVDAPVESETQAAAAIESALRRDYAALAEGLAEDGIALGELPAPEMPAPDATSAEKPSFANAVKLLATATQQVQTAGGGEVLAGLMVALLPSEITDDAAYQELVAALVACAERDRGALRLMVLDHPALAARPLAAKLPVAVAFDVDRPALVEFLKSMGQRPQDEPPPTGPKPTPEQKAAAERALGKRLPSESTGAELRALLLDAGSALSAGSPKVAVRKFRAARMLCRLAGLVEEEAATGIALGSAALAAGNLPYGLEAYRLAEARAIEAKNDSIAVHARLGIAGAHFMAKRYAEAALAYGVVAASAPALPPIHMEALRMQALSLREQGKRDDATTTLAALLRYGRALEPAVQQQTCYSHVAREHPELVRGPADETEVRPS